MVPSAVMRAGPGQSGSVSIPAPARSCPAKAAVLRPESVLPAALLPFCAGVPAIGVGQPARIAAEMASCGEPFLAISAITPDSVLTPLSESDALTVGQPASHTTRPSRPLSGTSTSGFPPSFQSRVVGVTHGAQVGGAPVEPLPDVPASGHKVSTSPIGKITQPPGDHGIRAIVNGPA